VPPVVLGNLSTRGSSQAKACYSHLQGRLVSTELHRSGQRPLSRGRYGRRQGAQAALSCEFPLRPSPCACSASSRLHCCSGRSLRPTVCVALLRVRAALQDTAFPNRATVEPCCSDNRNSGIYLVGLFTVGVWACFAEISDRMY
jgi:hypothetical protein